MRCVVAQTARASAAISASLVAPDGEMHVDEERQHRRGGGARRVHLGERALEDITGQPGLASREVDRRERTGRIRVRVRVDAIEQLLCLFEAALADAQVGKSHECALAQPRAPAEAPEPDRLGERRVGFWPSAGRGEHTAVVSPAEGSDERQVPPLRDGFAHTDPLVGPRDVVRVLARREELAEHLFHDEEVVDVAAGERRRAPRRGASSPLRCDPRARGSRRDRRAWRARGRCRRAGAPRPAPCGTARPCVVGRLRTCRC